MKFQKLSNNYLPNFNKPFQDFHIFRTILAIGTSKFFEILSLFHPHSNPQDPLSLDLSSKLYANQALSYSGCFSSLILSQSPHNLQILSSLLFPLHLPISTSNLQHPALNSTPNLLQILSSFYTIPPLSSPCLSPLFANSRSLLHHFNLILFLSVSPLIQF